MIQVKAIPYAAILALVLANVGPTTASIPTDFLVPAGETVFLSGVVNADTIRIDGTVHAVGDLTLVAQSIVIGSSAQILGNDGLGYVGYADGANLAFKATQALEILGVIKAGHGADMPHSPEFVGADGGEGGSVYVHAPYISVFDGAYLAPGHGGQGAAVTAVAPPAGTVVSGGNGGNAGIVLLDGTLSLPEGGSTFGAANGGEGGLASSSDSGLSTIVLGGSGGDGGLVATTDLAFSSHAPETGYTLFLDLLNVDSLGWVTATGQYVPDAQGNDKALTPTEELLNINFNPPRKPKDPIGPPPDPMAVAEFVWSLIPDPSGYLDNLPDPFELLPEDLPNPMDYLPEDLPLPENLPLPGGIGPLCDQGITTRCLVTLIGIEDESGGCGRGADGKDASNTGAPGGNGGKGAPGPSGTTMGGTGGPGGGGNPGGGAEAKGGDGGKGRCFFARGGDGGDGTAIGEDGGDGGIGGDGGSSSLIGGPGGRGGSCGAGGLATGTGGKGGSGGTFGAPGSPGKGSSTPGIPGQGGNGGEGGPGLIPGPSGAGGGCSADSV